MAWVRIRRDGTPGGASAVHLEGKNSRTLCGVLIPSQAEDGGVGVGACTKCFNKLSITEESE